MILPHRTLILRHGETVFNAAGRLQGGTAHTPLTRRGFAQADAIGVALSRRLGDRPPLTVWTSDAGRARQSWAIVAEHLGLGWFDARVDARLAEIDVGDWGGRTYAGLREEGTGFDPATGWFGQAAPGGEGLPDVAARLADWVADARGDPGDRLVVMHGMSSRVLRGLLIGEGAVTADGVAVAPALPQGSVVAVDGGVETLLVEGDGAVRA